MPLKHRIIQIRLRTIENKVVLGLCDRKGLEGLE